MNAEFDNWAADNQRYLMARIALVRAALQRHIESARQAESATSPAEAAASVPALAEPPLPPAAAPAALDALCAAFALSPFERDLLLLCAAVELAGDFPALCAAAHGHPQRTYPSFSLALAALPAAHWSALTPTAPLRRWRLLEVGAGESLVTAPLRIDERVLHYLTGISYLDPRLQGLLEVPTASDAELPLSQRTLAERMADVWASTTADALPLLQLTGDERVGKRAVALAACAALGLQLYILQAADVPGTATDREAFARLWEREAVLGHCALLVECGEADPLRTVLPLLQQLHGFVLVAAREPLRLAGRRLLYFEVSKPTTAEQREFWHTALFPLAPQLNGQWAETLDPLIAQFDLSLDDLRTAGALACGKAGAPATTPLGTLLWDACRATARGMLDDLAQRIEPVASWPDLVLPPLQMQTLRTIAAQVRQRTRVYHDWGFASKGTRGLGISALFAGASGTGKTMAAEVLAHELRLDLYRIDLSQVVSKYIGETEKNLRRVFDAAEAGGAILLFDEADALFGKRSEVKDSHDRYANIEISYLLQRMEAYRGLAILTTNLKNVLDTAFTRRLRFIVHFPFPDIVQRAEIWQRVFPVQTPVADLDVSKLARLNVTGGHIRNIALQAAFLAAEADEPVQMVHLLRAVRNEYVKQEKTLTEGEVRDWV